MAKKAARVASIKKRRPAQRTDLHSLGIVERAMSRLSLILQRGEDPRPALIDAIRAGAVWPTSQEDCNWIADVLEGKHTPTRKRGRPRARHRPTFEQLAREAAVSRRVDELLARGVPKWKALRQTAREYTRPTAPLTDYSVDELRKTHRARKRKRAVTTKKPSSV